MNSTDLLAFSVRAEEVNAALWPAVVLIAGVEYPASMPDPTILTGLIEGSETGDGSLAARVSISALPDQPAANQALKWKRPGATEWDARVWWIDQVSRSPIDAAWRITCSPKN